MCYQYQLYFCFQLSEERMHALIQVNITSAVKMTKAVLPQMVKRKKGLIVNMSSAAGNMPFQLISLYSATKVGVFVTSQLLKFTVYYQCFMFRLGYSNVFEEVPNDTSQRFRRAKI